MSHVKLAFFVVLIIFVSAGDLFGQISVLNSASAGFGRSGQQDLSGNYRIENFDVSGSDKLVVTVGIEIQRNFVVTYAGQALTKAVQLDGETTAGIYYLDNPGSVASSGIISALFLDGPPNGIGLFATALSGTASGFLEVATGVVGDPFASLNVSQANAYVIASAASDDLSLSGVPTNSPFLNETVDPPFAEVSHFNGLGNEIGSGLAIAAELFAGAPGLYEARFTNLSNQRNRETIVLASFGAAVPEPSSMFLLPLAFAGSNCAAGVDVGSSHG